MKSRLCAASLAIGLAALPARAGDRAVDYTGAIEGSGATTYTILAHDGAVRIDSPFRKGVASTYDAPGQLARVDVFRDSTGEVSLFIVSGRPKAWPARSDAWENAGDSRVLAGERCDVQQRVRTTDANNRRCVTPDGVVLAFYADHGQRVLAKVKRGRVDPAKVKPPLDLFDLKRWGLTKAMIARPATNTGGDYEAVFELEGGVEIIRRSGAWTSRIRTGPESSTRLVNEVAGIVITTTESEYGGPAIRFTRATKERKLWPFDARPASVNGVDVQTVAGETCRWRARTISVDAAELECLTEDGAVLGVGFSGPGGEPSSLPRSFVRRPMALAAILPDAAHYTPERYGLAAH